MYMYMHMCIRMRYFYLFITFPLSLCIVVLCVIILPPLFPLTQPERPASVRARAVKSELSDVEGLGFKLEERQKDILELKRSLKMKVRTIRMYMYM